MSQRLRQAHRRAAGRRYQRTLDATLAALTLERLHTVLRGKLDAALHLHELTRSSALSALVLFSSISGVFGAPGQASYAAGAMTAQSQGLTAPNGPAQERVILQALASARLRLPRAAAGRPANQRIPRAARASEQDLTAAGQAAPLTEAP